MRRGRLPLFLSAGLVALTVAAYAPLWRNDFIDYDDDLYITNNKEVTDGLTSSNVAWAWTTFRGAMYMPLTWMSLQLDGSLFPLRDAAGKRLPNPAVFHAQNLFWHTAVVLLLFALLRQATGALWRSALVAALFAVHPLHVESVAWATERKDVLSTFFWLLTMLAYLRYAQTSKPAWYLAVLAAYVLGLLSKPMLVTLPFTLLLIDVWPLGRLHWRRQGLPAKDGQEWPGERSDPPTAPVPSASAGWLLLEKIPLFALAAGASWLTLFGQRYAIQASPLEVVPISARLANAVVSCGWYLEKTFWPTGLAIFYPHSGGAWNVAEVIRAGGALLVVSLVIVLAARRMPWLPIAWLWFLGVLVPVIGLIQSGLQARADRFVYVPHIGLFVGLVWALCWLLARLRVPATAQASLFGLLLVGLAATTAVQVGCWRSTETVWSRALAVTTDNARAHLGLGRWFAEHAFRESTREAVRSNLQEARHHFERAAALRPNGQYYADLGMVCMIQGDWSAAADALSEAVASDANRADWWHDLGTVRMRQGRLDQAVKDYEQALAVERRSPASKKTPTEVNHSLANTLANLGKAHAELQQWDKAEACWQEALQLNAAEGVALNGKGLVFLRRNQVQPAVDSFAAAVRAVPGMAEAHSNLGVALGRLNDWSAVESHRRAIAIESNRQQWMKTPDWRALACTGVAALSRCMHSSRSRRRRKNTRRRCASTQPGRDVASSERGSWPPIRTRNSATPRRPANSPARRARRPGSRRRRLWTLLPPHTPPQADSRRLPRRCAKPLPGRARTWRSRSNGESPSTSRAKRIGAARRWNRRPTCPRGSLDRGFVQFRPFQEGT